MVGPGGGACVVVRARESRAHGEGGQGTDRVVKTEEPSMDLDDQADEVWLLSVQRKLYQWSRAHPEDSYRDLWNWITEIRNLRCAWRKIALNQGRRTAGVDGMTVSGIRAGMGVELFLEQLQSDLKKGRYQSSPSRRKLIPKPHQPGKFRPLGIPTVRDRVVQCAVKNILEPIFEASLAFCPPSSPHGSATPGFRYPYRIRVCANCLMRNRSSVSGSRMLWYRCVARGGTISRHACRLL